MYGSRATYHCNPGYILWGNSTRYAVLFDQSEAAILTLHQSQTVRQLRGVDRVCAPVPPDLLW